MNSTTGSLASIAVVPKTGDEPFHDNGQPIGDINLLSFWRWSASELSSNVLRGVVAEYLVGCALGLTSTPRTEWAATDFQLVNGVKIEVKSAGYVQSWGQQKLPTDGALKFRIAATTAWDHDAGKYVGLAKRQADIFVFAVYMHKEKPTIDVLNVAQWLFYVVPSSLLNEKMPGKNAITLVAIRNIGIRACGYTELAANIYALAESRAIRIQP